jgi:phosphomannomutase
MMDGYENKEGQEQEQGKNGQDIIFSKVIKAGKRTYFLDVKATRKNDYYLTITESKKRFKSNGKRFFEKHKVFLYKEDFDKFTESLEEVINFIKEEKKEEMEALKREQEAREAQQEQVEETANSSYTSDIEFEDLEESNRE